jgi:hypothetical protein
MRPVLLHTIHINLLPSNLLLGLIGTVSIVSCLILINLPIALYIKLVIIALILASSTYFILRDALLMLPHSWKTLEVDSKGALTMTNNRGQQFQPILAANSFIHEACTILNFKSSGFKLALAPVILFPNLQNADALRQLRVWLHWFKHHED